MMQRETQTVKLILHGQERIAEIWRYTGNGNYPWRYSGAVTFRFRTGQKRHGIFSPMVRPMTGDTWGVVPTSYRGRQVYPVAFADELPPNSEWDR